VTHHDVPRRHRGDDDLYNASAPPPDSMRRGYARSRARNAAIRAELQPLAPGERPLGIKLAAALALALALANVVALIAGHGDQLVPGIIAIGLLILAADGLWELRYWVVLAFEVVLGLSIVISAISLAFASNIGGAAIALAVIGVCAPIFWLLVRVMARLQVPQR
jgi:hypothetical protein